MINMPAKIWAGLAFGWTSDPDAVYRTDIPYIRADLVEQMAAALREAQSALAMIIEPKAIKSMSVLRAFAQATEAECRTRSALQAYEAAQPAKQAEAR